jgi:hypothetical protein
MGTSILLSSHLLLVFSAWAHPFLLQVKAWIKSNNTTHFVHVTTNKSDCFCCSCLNLHTFINNPILFFILLYFLFFLFMICVLLQVYHLMYLTSLLLYRFLHEIYNNIKNISFQLSNCVLDVTLRPVRSSGGTLDYCAILFQMVNLILKATCKRLQVLIKRCDGLISPLTKICRKERNNERLSNILQNKIHEI